MNCPVALTPPHVDHDDLGVRGIINETDLKEPPRHVHPSEKRDYLDVFEMKEKWANIHMGSALSGRG